MTKQNVEQDEKQKKHILCFALAFALLVIIFVAFVICRYHPTGIENNGKGEIVLATFIGEGDTIPTDSINIIPMPHNLMKDLIRTNGASYGKVKYGHFKNTVNGQKMFIYLTGKKDTLCFQYNDLLYVTDNWQK